MPRPPSHRVLRRLAVTIALVGTIVALGVWTRPARWETDIVRTIAAAADYDFRLLRAERDGVSFDVFVARFDRRRLHARLVDVASGQSLRNASDDAILAINGGYFDDAFAPLGLYRIEGTVVSPAIDRPPLSGVVTITDGHLDLGKQDRPDAQSAFQAGPFLIDPGGTLGIRSDDGKLAERTVVAIAGDSLVVIVTSPVTLHSVADWLHQSGEELRVVSIERALNLDGGPSAGYVARVGTVEQAQPPRGAIRSAIRFESR